MYGTVLNYVQSFECTGLRYQQLKVGSMLRFVLISLQANSLPCFIRILKLQVSSLSECIYFLIICSILRYYKVIRKCKIPLIFFTTLNKIQREAVLKTFMAHDSLRQKMRFNQEGDMLTCNIKSFRIYRVFICFLCLFQQNREHY